MKRLVGTMFAVIALSLLPVNSFSECLPLVEKSNPKPVKNFWGMSKCQSKIKGEMELGKDKTAIVKLEANQAYWFAASGCARVELIYIAVYGEEGVILKSDRGSQPAFCYRAEKSGKYTFLLSLEKTEPKVKKSNVSSCISLSECEE